MRGVFLSLVLAAVACGTAPAPTGGLTTMDVTVRYVDLEGGCWALDAEDGTRYEPMDLPEEYRRDALRVRVSLTPRDDLMSICQLGPIVEVDSIRLGEGARE